MHWVDRPFPLLHDTTAARALSRTFRAPLLEGRGGGEGEGGKADVENYRRPLRASPASGKFARPPLARSKRGGPGTSYRGRAGGARGAPPGRPARRPGGPAAGGGLPYGPEYIFRAGGPGGPTHSGQGGCAGGDPPPDAPAPSSRRRDAASRGRGRGSVHAPGRPEQASRRGKRRRWGACACTR